MLLAGDVGATKTELAVISAEAGPLVPLARAEFASASFPDLATVARAFLRDLHFPVDRACLAVAGPVLAGRATLTNLPWQLDESTLARELGLGTVHLLNDLEATAWAVPLLQPEDSRTLNSGEPVAGGAIAVIAPGTGLGEAFLTWDGSRYRAHPSEGGHADFAPADDVQVGLLRYLRERYAHVSVERVCSGLGIPLIYAYLRDRGHAPEAPELATRLATAADRTPIILTTALDRTTPDPLCAATLETFLRILGAEAGNLALKVLATGGVYLAGGLPRHVLPVLQDGRFLEAFRRKGRFGDLLGRMPVRVIARNAALLGAAGVGLGETLGRLHRREQTHVGIHRGVGELPPRGLAPAEPQDDQPECPDHREDEQRGEERPDRRQV
jgi:glucokinase